MMCYNRYFSFNSVVETKKARSIDDYLKIVEVIHLGCEGSAQKKPLSDVLQQVLAKHTWQWDEG